MACTSGQGRAATAAGSSAGPIAGGFVLVSVAGLAACWRACRAGPLGLGDFRSWLAAHEMVARRGRRPGGRPARVGPPASYSAAELAGLTGVTAKRARASIRRLGTAGLIDWAGGSIGFPAPPDPVPVPVPVPVPGGLSDTIGGGRGSIAIPRRLLRSLARGSGAALIATALAALLRCLSRRRGGWEGRGRFKASWVAAVFGVSQRRVKAARRELTATGWIEPGSSTGQAAENRWGRAYRINLEWRGPSARPTSGRPPTGPASPVAPSQGPPASPPAPAGRPAAVTPVINQEPFQEGVQDQEPGRGPAGVGLGGSGGGDKPLPSPALADVRAEDLGDIGRLLDLLGQAVARGLVGPSEADRLKFVAAAEHARGVGKENPPGLFAHLVRGACWRYITQADEDRANARIKAYLRGPGPPAVAPAARGLGASEDALLVREVRSAMAAAGYRGDPFPQVRRHDPGWTRERWDAAMSELGAGGPMPRGDRRFEVQAASRPRADGPLPADVDGRPVGGPAGPGPESPWGGRHRCGKPDPHDRRGGRAGPLDEARGPAL